MGGGIHLFCRDLNWNADATDRRDVQSVSTVATASIEALAILSPGAAPQRNQLFAAHLSARVDSIRKVGYEASTHYVGEAELLHPASESCIRGLGVLTDMRNASKHSQIERGVDRRCPLCSEIRDVNALSSRLALYENRKERIIFENTNFVLLRDISPIVPGHCLVVPRAHLFSLADMADELWEEFDDFYKAALQELQERTGSVTIVGFEHGSSGENLAAGACIDHAHLHLLPLPAQLSQPPARDWLETYGEVCDFTRLRDAATIGRTSSSGYLLYCSSNSFVMITNSLVEPVPSQYLRRSFARYIGLSEWNWKAVLSQE